MARDLEGKISAIRTAASLGASSAEDAASFKSRELSEIEKIVNAATEDVEVDD